MSTQVKSGYKLTEVGVIPEDWELSELSAVCMTSSGTTPARNLADRYYRNGTINWVKTLDLNNSEITDTDELVTQAALEETCLRVYPKGTVLVAMYGGFNQIGRTGLLRIPAAVNQAITAIQTKSTLHPEYLLATLNYRVDHWRSVASSSRKDPNITSQDVRSFKISFPPIKEQSAIAAALSDMDVLISGLDQLIAKKRDIKQAAMQQLLTGQQRLPGFSGKWETKTIGQITECVSGGTPNTLTPAYWGGDVRWMSSGELNLKVVSEVDGRITNIGLENSSTKIIPAFCVLVGLAGQGKTRGTVAKNVVELCTNQSIAAILPSPLFSTDYLYYNLDSRYDELRSLSTGDGGRGGLNLSIIRSLTVPFPTLIEQIAIANILSDMDSELTTLETRRDKARQLKQGMMQELLTGRIRLL